MMNCACCGARVPIPKPVKTMETVEEKIDLSKWGEVTNAVTEASCRLATENAAIDCLMELRKLKEALDSFFYARPNDHPKANHRSSGIESWLSPDGNRRVFGDTGNCRKVRP